MKLLKGRPEINPAQIGLQGTSLGGWVAPLAASRSSDVAFVIVESAPALTPLEHEKLRVRSQLRADGFAPPAMMQALAFMDQKFEVARTGKGWDRLQSSMTRNAQTGWISYVNPPSSLESLQWHWDNVLSYDPLPALEKLTCPVLVLYGELDTIVPAGENKKRMEAVLEAVGHARHDDQGVRARESRVLRGDQRRQARGRGPEGARAGLSRFARGLAATARQRGHGHGGGAAGARRHAERRTGLAAGRPAASRPS